MGVLFIKYSSGTLSSRQQLLNKPPIYWRMTDDGGRMAAVDELRKRYFLKIHFDDAAELMNLISSSLIKSRLLLLNFQ